MAIQPTGTGGGLNRHTTGIGQAGEEAVAAYLKKQGFEILARNWKTRWCEIDIVSKKGARVHFVEVKFRKNSIHGSGLEFITSSKIKQLKLAARFWVSEYDWEGDYQIDAAGVDGRTGEIEYIDSAVTA